MLRHDANIEGILLNCTRKGNVPRVKFGVICPVKSGLQRPEIAGVAAATELLIPVPRAFVLDLINGGYA
jgi:hypothetical protein